MPRAQADKATPKSGQAGRSTAFHGGLERRQRAPVVVAGVAVAEGGMGAKPSNLRQKAIVKEMESWPGFVERTCLSSSDLSTLAAAFRKACEVGENEYLERNDFEHWLEMGSKPSNLENRLFVVFSVTSPDQEVEEDDERASALMAECAGTDPMEIDQWEKFCRGYPNLLHPIFKLQKSLQEATLGRKQWAKIGSKLQKREKALEEERARMLREAVTDEDKARVRAEIEAKLAEEAAIVGSRSHRFATGTIGELQQQQQHRSIVCLQGETN
eukprot:jgi/Undpi1/7036/HiC_scaffold_21.g09510.m1